ncbi:hypothetical protein VHUM_01641 [Vanrija humicola]|uniref:Beta-lactamase-related domain-containing protein n=1 Tax=Vanrija humicola TaxID=5417 RepID=A0A7D8V0Q0_VANHU|nr:hypothetical protein VHUM_01641 [Vanrija humicola]
MTTDPTPTPRLTPAAAAALDALLARVEDTHTLPAVTLGVIAAQGEPLYFSAQGDRVLGEPDKGRVDATTYLELFSQTKLVTAVAVLQLVDSGAVALDDAGVIAAHAPELLEQQVLSYDDAGNEVLTPRMGELTLRTLLTHTSGLVYAFESPTLAKWEAAYSPPTQGRPDAGLAGYVRPLVFQPGSQWAYGTGVDWAGVIVERVSGLSLAEYFAQHIFSPLGLTDLGFYFTEDNAPRFQTIQTRTADGWAPVPKGTLRDRTPGVRYAQLSGGAGLVGTARDYLLFLQAILAAKDGGSAVLSKAGYAELFADSLSDGVRAQLNARPDKALKQAPGAGPALGWSVGLELNLADGEFGRKKGSGYWGGAAKTSFWLDPASGIAVGGACSLCVRGQADAPRRRPCSRRRSSARRSLTWATRRSRTSLSGPCMTGWSSKPLRIYSMHAKARVSISPTLSSVLCRQRGGQARHSQQSVLSVPCLSLARPAAHNAVGSEHGRRRRGRVDTPRRRAASDACEGERERRRAPGREEREHPERGERAARHRADERVVEEHGRRAQTRGERGPQPGRRVRRAQLAGRVERAEGAGDCQGRGGRLLLLLGHGGR